MRRADTGHHRRARPDAGYTPKHARRYAEGADLFTAALRSYTDDVREARFPTEEHSFPMDEAELEGLA